MCNLITCLSNFQHAKACKIKANWIFSVVNTIIDYLALGLGRLLILPLELLPNSIAILVARFYVRLIFLVMPRLSRVARRNLEMVFPQMSDQERQVIFQKSKRVLAENILGFAKIPTLSKAKAEEMCPSFVNVREKLQSMRNRSKGVGIIAPTLHFDAFEYFVQVCAICDRPFAILGRNFPLKHFNKWWKGRREYFGHTIYDRSGGFQETIRRLNNGEDVIILCDQNVKANHAVFVDFFGIPAATSKIVALAALRTGALILFGSPVRTSADQFQMNIEEIPHPSKEEGSTEEKIEKCMAHLHRAFEKQILLRPEAWFWIHRRWKTRPANESKSLYS